jgi:RNA-directed DNA polymerase
MCNVYLNQIDRVWSVREHGVLVRFADDAVVMCATREQAEAALARLRRLLADVGLEPKEAKTRIVHLTEGGPGLDFLGFHHRLVRSRGIRDGRGYLFVARWPSDKAMQHARDRIRQLTQRSRLLLPVEAVVRVSRGSWNFGDDPIWMLGGGTDSFGAPDGGRVGVSA